MSIDVNWSKLAGGEEKVRQFIHDKFQQVRIRRHLHPPAGILTLIISRSPCRASSAPSRSTRSTLAAPRPTLKSRTFATRCPTFTTMRTTTMTKTRTNSTATTMKKQRRRETAATGRGSLRRSRRVNARLRTLTPDFRQRGQGWR
ncbi:hypothetical protein BKA81DRAFT_10753 [Phyllosticta paracitricarpa]